MKELELKHIAGYFPYKTQFKVNGKPCIQVARGSYINNIGQCMLDFKTGFRTEIQFCKPILRPMTDLNKPIKVEGYNDNEEFVPINSLNKICLIISADLNLKSVFEGYLPINSCRDFINLLYQWHFDYQNLIEQGLAIDINTLIEE